MAGSGALGWVVKMVCDSSYMNVITTYPMSRSIGLLSIPSKVHWINILSRGNYNNFQTDYTIYIQSP